MDDPQDGNQCHCTLASWRISLYFLNISFSAICWRIKCLITIAFTIYFGETHVESLPFGHLYFMDCKYNGIKELLF
jgi:hypothetical protein